jgi:hypothetical protein
MGIGEIEDAAGRKQRSDRLGPAGDVGDDLNPADFMCGKPRRSERLSENLHSWVFRQVLDAFMRKFWTFR